MRNATIKGLLAHKLRLALTALSIVLGVGFVAGTFVLGDTMAHTFDVLFKDALTGTDVEVHSQSAFNEHGEGGDTRNPVPESLLGTINRVSGVRASDGVLMGFAQIVDK